MPCQETSWVQETLCSVMRAGACGRVLQTATDLLFPVALSRQAGLQNRGEGLGAGVLKSS